MHAGIGKRYLCDAAAHLGALGSAHTSAHRDHIAPYDRLRPEVHRAEHRHQPGCRLLHRRGLNRGPPRPLPRPLHPRRRPRCRRSAPGRRWNERPRRMPGSGSEERSGSSAESGSGRAGRSMPASANSSRRALGSRYESRRIASASVAHLLAQLAPGDRGAVHRNRVGDLDEPHVADARLRSERHAVRERHDVVSRCDA